MKTVTLKIKGWVEKTPAEVQAAETTLCEIQRRRQSALVQIVTLMKTRRTLYREMRTAMRAVDCKVRGEKTVVVAFSGVLPPTINGSTAPANSPLVRRALKVINGGLSP